MKRATLFGILLIVLLAPSLEAQEVTCILTNTCKPLPCEFLSELKLAQATARAYRTARVGPRGGTTESLRRSVREPLRKAFTEYFKCPVRTMPNIEVKAFYVEATDSARCEIGVAGPDGTFQPMTRDEFRRESESCSEIEDAEYKKAEWGLIGCKRLVGNGRFSVDDFRFEESWSEQMKANSLQASLLKYLSSCAPDAALSDQLAKMGLDALMRAGGQDRIAWKATRAGQAAASRFAPGMGAAAGGGLR